MKNPEFTPLRMPIHLSAMEAGRLATHAAISECVETGAEKQEVQGEERFPSLAAYTEQPLSESIATHESIAHLGDASGMDMTAEEQQRVIGLVNRSEGREG